jgi:hypothetical protein
VVTILPAFKIINGRSSWVDSLARWWSDPATPNKYIITQLKLERILIDAWYWKELVAKNERIDSVCQIHKDVKVSAQSKWCKMMPLWPPMNTFRPFKKNETEMAKKQRKRPVLWRQIKRCDYMAYPWRYDCDWLTIFSATFLVYWEKCNWII